MAHLYQGTIGRVRWFIRRFGAAELVRLPLRILAAPLVLRLLRPGHFTFRGAALPYFYHRYNVTWANERCVEVPIARSYLAQATGETLEVGNVLAHYAAPRHTVLDKFERAPGVVNADIVGYDPGRKFALILSISTFEHIGFDDEGEGPSGAKILAALASCRRLLAPGGKLVVTAPLGYNPELDALIEGDRLGSACAWFVKRVARREWRVVPREEAMGARFGRPFPFANVVWVAEFEPA
jgi:SAM-dependent methyltransferase